MPLTNKLNVKKYLLISNVEKLRSQLVLTKGIHKNMFEQSTEL